MLRNYVRKLQEQGPVYSLMAYTAFVGRAELYGCSENCKEMEQECGVTRGAVATAMCCLTLVVLIRNQK